MYQQSLALLFLCSTAASFFPAVEAFLPLSATTSIVHRGDGTTTLTAVSRRSFVELVPGTVAVAVAIAAGGSFLTNIPIASASGGATAGGAYLLSAKQRYNARVSAAVVAFVAIGKELESGDLDSVRTFFTDEDVGSWKDFTASGYLLANAFRRSSNTPPDSLPSVKKWKAFSAEVESMIKSLKKKDTKGALAAHEKAIAALDEYLAQVELPASKEVTIA